MGSNNAARAILRRLGVASRRWRVACLLLASILLATDASARTYGLPPLADLFEYADLVATVKIEGSQEIYVAGKLCGTRYTAKITEAFKTLPDRAISATIVFGGYELSAGDEYLLFLKQYDPEGYYAELKTELLGNDTISDADKSRVIAHIQCDGLVPGLIARPDRSWKIVRGRLIVEGPIRIDLPASVQFEKPDPVVHIINAEDVFSYFRRLK